METREQVKSIVNNYPEGISLTDLHHKFHRIVTRLQLRTVLGVLYMKGEISRERILKLNRRITKYFPFNDNTPVKKKFKPVKEQSNEMLSMKDFMPGMEYQPFIEP